MSTQPTKPDLSLSQETKDFLARMLLGGGAKKPAHTNGHSAKISALLASEKCGFSDKTRYSDCQ